ncbi:hypothetical protein BXZ70DRAFT_1040249 [Cristinia sonorae]|uniref:Uncharacterized protein n=1 Tax=Cristinia sonorae TaxID=1940300 RepID=A0A8K0UIB6_9AGAR|nr:hypothetical protein BXZ70DRAFT_1040249 [Cristinia sonorae]
MAKRNAHSDHDPRASKRNSQQRPFPPVVTHPLHETGPPCPPSTSVSPLSPTAPAPSLSATITPELSSTPNAQNAPNNAPPKTSLLPLIKPNEPSEAAPANPAATSLATLTTPSAVQPLADALEQTSSHRSSDHNPDLAPVPVPPPASTDVRSSLRETYAHHGITGYKHKDDDMIWATMFPRRVGNRSSVYLFHSLRLLTPYFQLTPFRAIYDAREVMGDRRTMVEMDPEELNKCDVVLVEFKLQRSHIARTDTTTAKNKMYGVTPWINWTIFFQLQVVFVLKSVSPATVAAFQPQGNDGEF